VNLGLIFEVCKWDENDVDGYGYEWIVILVLIFGTSINGVWCGVMM